MIHSYTKSEMSHCQNGKLCENIPDKFRKKCNNGIFRQKYNNQLSYFAPRNIKSIVIFYYGIYHCYIFSRNLAGIFSYITYRCSCFIRNVTCHILFRNVTIDCYIFSKMWQSIVTFQKKYNNRLLYSETECDMSPFQ